VSDEQERTADEESAEEQHEDAEGTVLRDRHAMSILPVDVTGTDPAALPGLEDPVEQPPVDRGA
jgi:hypothetical protein